MEVNAVLEMEVLPPAQSITLSQASTSNSSRSSRGTSSQGEDLKCHMATHPKVQPDKPFVCTRWCNMTFSHKQNLDRHLTVHSGEKAYACNHCGKCFSTPYNQKRHEQIHGKTTKQKNRESKKKAGRQPTLPAASTAGTELQHFCIDCKKGFSSRVAINRHKRECVKKTKQQQQQTSNRPKETATHRQPASLVQLSSETHSIDWRRYNFPPEFVEMRDSLRFGAMNEKTSPSPKLPSDLTDSLNDHNHEADNYPNPYGMHLELESAEGAPVDCFQYYCCPVGMLQTCQVVSTSYFDSQLQCTKCQGMFIGIVELHTHILLCGGTDAEEKVIERRKRICHIFKRGIKRSHEEEEPVKRKRSCVLKKEQLAFSKKQAKTCIYCGNLCRTASGLRRHQKLCHCPQSIF